MLNWLKKNRTTIEFIVFGLMILIFLLMQKSCNKKEDIITLNNNVNSYSDSVNYYKNKYGQVIATNTILVSNSTKDFLAIKSKDSTIIKLQKLVNDYKSNLKNGGSVTTVSTQTNINNTTATTIIIPVIDTSNLKGKENCNPTFITSFTNGWIEYKINANKDSTELHLQTKDQYSVIIGEKRDKWYKAKKPFVDVISDSPYSKVKTISAYEVKDKRPRRISIGIQAGIGYTLKGIQPYIGIGGSFNLINIK